MATLPLRRPSELQDLIDRFQSTASTTTEEEKDALRNICRCMIKTYKDDLKLSYAVEAALLAPVLRHGESQELLIDLITALSNNIISGTADQNIPYANFLKAFAFVLWHTGDVSSIDSTLGFVLSSLAIRLKQAKNTAAFGSQYQLVCGISAILDSMIDIKSSGLSREEIHGPLLKQLKELCHEKDCRLNLISNYAYQALLGIKDDEGLYKALWRYITTGAQMTADLAGAVAKMDPGALLSSLPSASSVLGLVEKLYELGGNIANIITEMNEGKEFIDGMTKLTRQRGWYKALRYTDLLLQARAYNSFRELVQRIPCRSEKYFMCGLYAQIEACWIAATSAKNSNVTEQLVKLYDEVSRDMPTQEPIVQAWAEIAGRAMGRTLPVLSERKSRNPFKQPKVLSTNLDPFVKSGFSGSNASSLLMKAWSLGDAALSKIFYADISIKRKYKTGKALQIERLSGELLPLEQCYINLALVERVAEKTTALDPTSFSLEARLRLEARNPDGNIPLGDLFNERKLSNNSIAQPRRIFIQGRAGVGKSTMCKKIVYDFINGTLAPGKFDRLLWLSLRRLIGKTEGYTWYDLVDDEFLDDSMSFEDRKDYSELVGNRLSSDKSFQDRTLVLLDGLDEVSRRWASHTSMHKILQRLLQMPNIIVTSRPQTHVLETENFDLQLETLGFLPHQVSSYIEHSLVDQTIIKHIHEFLGQRPLVQGLMRIPIQLDAFCYAWSRISPANISKISTMTPLYQAICDELGKKDIIRLEKEFQVQSLAEFEIKDHLENEQSFLKEFAFQGLYNGIIEFSPHHQDQIASFMNRRGIKLQRSYRIVLESLSFLRTSGLDSEQNQKHYHFLHLTFQEFFAAKQWADHWQQDIPLNCLSLSSEGIPTQMMPSEFLAKEKYNSRYNIFWRFVAGLIQSEQEIDPTRKKLHTFFDELEGYPRDELGYMHHRLLMYTLNEVTETKNEATCALRRKLESKLHYWAALEAKTHTKYLGWPGGSLIRQNEFPESVIEDWLRDLQWIKTTLRALNKWQIGSPRILGHIIRVLEDFSHPGVVLHVIRALAFQNELPQPIIDIMVCIFKSADSLISKEAERVLRHQRKLSLENITSIMPELESHSDQAWIAILCKSLGNHSHLEKWVLVSIMKSITFEAVHESYKVSCADIFVDLFKIPQDFSMAEIVDSLSSSEIAYAVESLFAPGRTLTQGHLDLLEHLIKNHGVQVKLATLEALELWDDPDHIVAIMLPLLNDSDLRIRGATSRVLAYRKSYSIEVQEALLDFLLDENAERNETALRILAMSSDKQIELDMNLMLILQRYLQNPGNELCTKALHVLGRQSRLPVAISESICARIESDEEKIVELTLDAILGNRNLHPLILMSLSGLLNQSKPSLIEKIFIILMQQSELPGAVSKSLCAILPKISKEARIRVLQKSLCDWDETASETAAEIAAEIQNNLIKSMEDSNEDVRVAALHAIMSPVGLERLLRSWVLDEQKDHKLRILAMKHRQTSPSTDPRLMIDDWETLLNDKDPLVVRDAAEAIDQASKHDVELFPYFMKHLLDNDNREPEKQLSEIKLRGDPYNWVPGEDEVNLWKKVPIESFAIIARLLQWYHLPEEFDFDGYQNVADQILYAAPELSLQTWQILVALWNDPERDDIAQSRELIMSIIESKSTLRLPAVVNNLVMDFLSNRNLQQIVRKKTQKRLIHWASKICARQLKYGRIDINIVAQTLNLGVNPDVVERLMKDLVEHDADRELLTLLDDKALAVLIEFWLLSAHETELSCYQRENGLYLYRNGHESKLDLDKTQVNRVLRVISEVKTELGYREMIQDISLGHNTSLSMLQSGTGTTHEWLAYNNGNFIDFYFYFRRIRMLSGQP